ncbi:MAG TPA: bifunctional glutamate N-acetyltransferase/amino-acid acetyltransferase ArgJ [Candidatus Glassbacteria bacterium]|nr:bifunctional glutamate N-acetyltransferase/amino-acid acetyltransferase ArgJ [Candidatus Glassbacteria bacterium]
MEIPRGFLFAAGEAGLRTHGSGPDLGLVYSTVPAGVAALFTTNRVKAAPVLVSQQHLRGSRNKARAIVINAGNANCATGRQGMDAARQCAKQTAKLLAIPSEQVLLASTGVIGVPLDPGQITSQLPALARRLHPEGCGSVAQAILTTDTRPKVAFRSLKLAGKNITILGMAKGAGMIYPRLATMLGFFFTDAAVEPRFLQAAARRMCDLSFNRISVDGDTSTNDTVYVLANGMAGNRMIRAKSAEGEKFLRALTEVAQQLALELVRDGEGAGKMAEIRVEKAASEKQAEAIARSIGLSSLVKTALAGADPNWGRILSAAGNAGVDMEPDRVDIYLNRILVCKKGMAARYDEAAAQRELQGREALIRVVLHQGTAAARFWTCDFTEEYIRINASYRT